jgi:hypothetical protein
MKSANYQKMIKKDTNKGKCLPPEASISCSWPERKGKKRREKGKKRGGREDVSF